MGRCGYAVVRATGVVVKTVAVKFFCCHRPARLGGVARRADRRALVLHGPVRGGADRPRPGPSRRYATGSVHIVDLPDPAAARAFAFDEPGYQAGRHDPWPAAPAVFPAPRRRSAGGGGLT